MNWLALVLAIANSPLAGRIFKMFIQCWREQYYGVMLQGFHTVDMDAHRALEQIVAKLEGESHE